MSVQRSAAYAITDDLKPSLDFNGPQLALVNLLESSRTCFLMFSRRRILHKAAFSVEGRGGDENRL